MQCLMQCWEGKEAAYLRAAHEWRRRNSRSSGGQPEQFSLLKLGGVTTCNKAILFAKLLAQNSSRWESPLPNLDWPMQDATVQVLREAIERSSSINFGRCFGGKHAGHHVLFFSLSGLYSLVAYSHFCWKGTRLEVLHVWDHLAALLGRRVLPRSAYRMIHNSVCLNNPDAKLRDLEIKDLSTVTIMKDPKSADLAIDEKASV